MLDRSMLGEISPRICVEVETPHIVQLMFREATGEENAITYGHGRVESTLRKIGGWTW